MKKPNWKVKKKIKRPEQSVQIGIFNNLKPLMAYQKCRQFIALHIPNGGGRSEIEAAIFKAMGVMAGAADILLLFPPQDGAPYGKAVFAELKYLEPQKPPKIKKDGTPYKQRKRNPGAGQDPNQKQFQEWVEALGFDYHLIAVASPQKGVEAIYKILRDNGVKV